MLAKGQYVVAKGKKNNIFLLSIKIESHSMVNTVKLKSVVQAKKKYDEKKYI